MEHLYSWQNNNGRDLFEKLERQAGHTIANASNLSAVADGIITIEGVHALLQNCTEQSGGVAARKCCGYHPRAAMFVSANRTRMRAMVPRDKSHPGMVLALMQALGLPLERAGTVGKVKNDRMLAEAASGYLFQQSRFLRSAQEFAKKIL